MQLDNKQLLASSAVHTMSVDWYYMKPRMYVFDAVHRDSWSSGHAAGLRCNLCLVQAVARFVAHKQYV